MTTQIDLHSPTDRSKPFKWSMVIDLDKIAGDLCGDQGHLWDRNQWLGPALHMRNDMLGQLTRPCRYDAAWLTLTAPKARRRQWWQDQVAPHEIIVLETPARICEANAQAQGGRDVALTMMMVDEWWHDYRPRKGKERAIAWQS